ncbi:Dabb family protein [Tropicimonas sp. TH_r6]|uniref:Dabb family protein n=1 Tax=Tropicimonas sp. TH_r6 TaxID=3082085 RepID=UPI002954B1CF|nr:Dabb family protein [Tropicimonas sp. TH_r6]MDV7142120.1 Dabb family protein [Tropicimonas sp. TH_r6]
MIRHCVMLRLPDGFDRTALDAIVLGLAELVDDLPGADGFKCGPNRDFESKTADFPFGFTIDFDSPDALSHYAGHPDHVALGARLVAMCEDGAEGIAVFDLEVAGDAE